MIKKKLEPLRKPVNFNEAFTHPDVSLVESITQLLRQQRRTNNLLQHVLIGQSAQTLQPKSIERSSQIPIQLTKGVRNSRIKFEINNSHQNSMTQIENQFSKSGEKGSFPEGSDKGMVQNTINAITNKISNDKKNYNVLNEFIQYTDRRQFKLLIDFETAAKQFPNLKNIEDLQKITIEWIGDVFRMVASMCWNMILNGFLTFEESKILFTQNIIYNYIEFMKELQLRGFEQHKHRLTTLINKKSINILEFLGKQFPQTKVGVPNIRLKQILPNTNNSSRMKFDIITIASRKANIEIHYKQSMNYSVQIMRLINFMIDQINQCYPKYEKQCHFIFQQIFKLPDKRVTPEEGFNRNNETADVTQDIMYREKVKKYTKFLIGRKVDKNVPKFSNQQINSGLFFPKSPAILRIITKWVEQLTDIIKKPEQHILSADKQLKTHDGDSVIPYSEARWAVCEKIKEDRQKLFAKIETIKKQCFYIESILASPKYTEDSTQSHLSLDQISVGKFSVCVQKAISAYIFQQLNQILGFLLKVPLDIDVKKIGIVEQYDQIVARRQLDDLNLITMKIFDLLRCKCISNEQEIIWIMNYLIERSAVDENFKLIRVKDRLSEGTRDINCNIRFQKGGFLSQMQLSVVSNIQSKQEKLDYYNHFLYELKRSKLGPLSESVSIWTVLEQRSLYFQKVLRNPIPQKPVFHQCSNENLEKFSRPICCDSCYNFYPYPETVYSNVKCSKCKKTYCGQCYSIVLSNADKKAMIFEGLFKESILSHIREHTDPSVPFPIQGLFFKRYHERREINFFTLLLKCPQTHQNLTFETILKAQQSAQKKQSQFPVHIIFTQNLIRNQKVEQRQKNVKQTIKAVLKDQKLIFINEKDYSFFNKYLLYYFDEKWVSSVMTLNQMQQFLKLQQNHKLRILNIMEEPVYVDEIRYIKKKPEKLRQLYRLKKIFSQNPETKFLTFRLERVFIVAKVYKDEFQLGLSVNYANNISKLKSSAEAQKSIIEMQRHQLKDQFKNLVTDIGVKFSQKLYKNLRKAYFDHNNLGSLLGLKRFTLLEVLYVKQNNLKSLQGVQQMKRLSIIRLDNNQIQDLGPLKHCTSLKRLLAISNNITSIEPIRNLRELRYIDFENNFIKSYQPIKDLQELEEINFKKNPDPKPLVQFAAKGLKAILISFGTVISGLQTLTSYTKLQRLMLRGVGLKSIPEFIKDMRLNEIWIGYNYITQISNLQNQTQLQIINFQYNQVTSLKGFENCQKIKIIYCRNNNIKSLSGIKRCFQTLQYVHIVENPLEDINDLIYADENFKIDYSYDHLSESAKQFHDELHTMKMNSSGSEEN